MLGLEGKTAIKEGEYVKRWARYFESPRTAAIASRTGWILKSRGAGLGNASRSPSLRAMASAPGTTYPLATAKLAMRVASASRTPSITNACLWRSSVHNRATTLAASVTWMCQRGRDVGRISRLAKDCMCSVVKTVSARACGQSSDDGSARLDASMISIKALRAAREMSGGFVSGDKFVNKAGMISAAWIGLRKAGPPLKHGQ